MGFAMAEDLEVVLARTYRRLVIDLDDLQVAFDLHPSLTVIAADVSQAGTLVELFGTAHAVARSGVHLEYEDAAGRSVLAFRPYGAPPRHIDLQSGALLEAEPTTSPVASSPHSARYEGEDDTLRRLAALAQATLWSAADQLTCAETCRNSRLDELASIEGVGADQALKRWSNRAARRRLRALADAMAELDRAENHWRSLAGTTSVSEALALRPLVESIAEVRDTTRSVLAVSRPTEERTGRHRRRAPLPTAPVPDLADRAATVVADALRRPERPLVLSLVAAAVEPAEAVTILDVLAGLPSVGQVIVISDQEEVTDWGQLESVTSRASFVDLRPVPGGR